LGIKCTAAATFKNFMEKFANSFRYKDLQNFAGSSPPPFDENWGCFV